ncbi:MAG: DNA-deoxyinosine glycosylase [Oscillospiraceae bacterium]|nr:DNA-deoxyinosine glycosylase [Oscillospiraceae bacterium]
MKYQQIQHPIPPLFDENSEILILGSFPSVKSRESGFFYGHPQNRFWRVTASVFSDTVPQTVPEKRCFLLRHHIAVWDVIASCEIAGSSDSSIRNVVPNDLSVILNAANIRRIFVNGGTADRFYQKYQLPRTGIPAVKLPSTSPANAAWGFARLCEAWAVLRAGD